MGGGEGSSGLNWQVLEGSMREEWLQEQEQQEGAVEQVAGASAPSSVHVPCTKT